VLLFPASPKECFDMTADAFDLADELQTPIILMTDLDLGMNDHISAPLSWDDKRRYKRGKVLSAEDLEKIERFGRYRDVDNDGIPYRTYPGTHPTRGSYFTRGTSRDEYAVYTEDGNAYKQNMDRLMKKWETAKNKVHEPEVYQKINSTENGIVFFGTSTYSVEEALDELRQKGIVLDALRLRSFPFNKTVEEFMAAHKKVFVIEQNRDAQMKSLISIELQVDPNRLISVLNYDGLPITAHHIALEISKNLFHHEKVK
jgi:2-oxoglutarate ferredoxin oxidoreductase subunit alpha